MKKILLLSIVGCIGILFAPDSYACRNSHCKTCPDGFSYIVKCCKQEQQCILIKNNEENCGEGKWKEYTQSFQIFSDVKECCLPNECITSPSGTCGLKNLKEYPITKEDCCNSDFTKCTGRITHCPRCR